MSSAATRPARDGVVGGDRLRGLEREAAGEHAEAAEYRLLLGGKQAVAPLQRAAQRLVPPQHRARAAGQHVETLAEPCPQPLDAQERHPGGGELQRERDAIQVATDVDHGGGVALAEREPRIGRPRRRDEELDRRVAPGRVGIGRRHRQRREAVHLLVDELERLLARHQHAHVGREAPQCLDQRHHAVEQVLAVVEHEQELLRAQHRGHGVLRRALGRYGNADDAGDRAADERRIRERGELDHPRAVGKRRRHRRGQRLREARLADAARPDDRHQRVPAHELVQFVEVAFAPHHRRQVRRDVGARRRRRRLGAANCNGRRRRRPDGLDRQRQPIAASGHGRDRRGAEQLAQREHLYLQVVLLDDEPWPHGVHQFALGDHPLVPRKQCHQRVERAAAELHRRPVAGELPQGGVQLEPAEAPGGGQRRGDGDVGLGHGGVGGESGQTKRSAGARGAGNARRGFQDI